MKKLLSLLLVAFLVLVLAACGTADDENNTSAGDTDENATETEGTEATDENTEAEETVEIKVGATSVPHAEVLDEAKELLAAEGIELVIEEYQDYILPNQDLSNGELDANYFQHIPYLESQIAEFEYDFVNLGGIHVEPMGVYSTNITSVEDIPEGTEVIISRSVPDHGRILALFESQGLIKLDESVNKAEATIDDIVENELNLEFSPDVDAAVLPEMYEREEDALVAINTNYAIEAGLSPLDDSLFVEGADSPYVNVIAVRSEDENNEALLKLVEVLQSEEIQNFISETYNGEVVAVGGEN
ncbi:MetQ/NlpA family ABC transporter substrate-binding protein [Aquibacillus koreensis]|uniref:Lipoprotein n=1 Tax=Aquibacillus koreensis TaxID=279446 RepID=A0A9X4AHR4_9BACI|nr:MetQ/NlpA family ABC transporter substrate-binding protein [Aquibacillus koreensis]MCT2535926.1 MetQ/NlpA family ABC transporter substrate-binding protein [Aquibacillus koreensis]MDC3420382.1 MetQ/NlpA family ABC transporter substrate-binding protein [Aquibacillus koreensis]